MKTMRPILVVFSLILLIASVGYWRANRNKIVGVKKILNVGYLPVTCHLTCPVTHFATSKSSDYRFISNRFTDFPTMAEAFKAGKLKAAFFVAPMAMKIRELGTKAKIVYLGHRDGSTVMVRKDSPIQNLHDLKGKKFAIPSRYSNQYLVIRKLMKDQGVNPADIEFLEVPPPEMPAGLANNSFDAYFVGEPYPAKVELNGVGRVLYHAKDIWPKFISCVLIVSEELIKSDPDVVRELVSSIAASGEWAEHNREEAAALVAPYYRQDEKLLRFVLTSPKDRVSYAQLTPEDKDIQQIHDMALEAGLLTKAVNLSDLLDRSFVPTVIEKRDIEWAGN